MPAKDSHQGSQEGLSAFPAGRVAFQAARPDRNQLPSAPSGFVMNKNSARLRRAKSTRSYPQARRGAPVGHAHRPAPVCPGLHFGRFARVASASTVETAVRDGLSNCKNKDAAARVSRTIAEARQGGRGRVGRVRPLRLPLPRPHQGARRRGARGGAAVRAGIREWHRA